MMLRLSRFPETIALDRDDPTSGRASFSQQPALRSNAASRSDGGKRNEREVSDYSTVCPETSWDSVQK